MDKKTIIKIYNEVLDLRNRLSFEGYNQFMNKTIITLDYVLDLIENNILYKEGE